MLSEELRHRLYQFPRAPQFARPSPLDPLARLQSILPGDGYPRLWVKRDDLLGPAIGGNKGRKLVYLMGEALAKGKRKVATYGGLQSNSARMTAAACASLDMQAHVFYFDQEPEQYTGNLLLNRLLGANLHFYPLFGGEKSWTLETTNKLVHFLAALTLGPAVYFIPNGGHNLTGCLGYVEGAWEIQEDVLKLGLDPQKVTVITAAGTGGTLAGLLAGFSLLDSPIKVLGIDIAKLFKGYCEGIAHMAGQLTAKLGQPQKFTANDVPIVEGTYVGQGYAKATAEGLEAIRLMAQHEGILLDPVYTGKTVAGVLDMAKNGRFAPDEHLIFLHTGGTPGLWANHTIINEYLNGIRAMEF